MEPKTRAGRNRTLVLTKGEEALYLQRCCHEKELLEQNSLLDRTIMGDCLSVLPHLPAKSVDLLIVDPPYNLSKRYSGSEFRKMDDLAYEAFTRSWIEACLPALKETASIYVCCDWRTSLIIGPIVGAYFSIQNRITWQREKGRGALRNWKNALEDIWFATVSKDYLFQVEAVKQRRRVIAPYRENGKPKDWQETERGKFRDTFPSNFWDDISIPYWSMPENTDHPAQKPEKLFAKLILASSRAGDVVLDPFAGVGTASVVAKKLGRHYIGIEREPAYCALAEKRLELAGEDVTIQGYVDQVFWERNSLAEQKKTIPVPEKKASTVPKKWELEEKGDGDMYHRAAMEGLVAFLRARDGMMDKEQLSQAVQARFALERKGSVFTCEAFSIRFSHAAKRKPSNTVLSLKTLRKYDDKPMVICIVTPQENVLLLGNTTFLAKISHSSKALRLDHVRGSFNSSDIMRVIGGIDNRPEHFEALFQLHEVYTKEENLARLVEATNAIVPKGKRFEPTGEELAWIRSAGARAEKFLASQAYQNLRADLNGRVRQVTEEIAAAARIKNINIRGRVIEFLITAADSPLKNEVKACLRSGRPVPAFKTEDGLGDYVVQYRDFLVAAEIKTKLLSLGSNPKGYNVDKLLTFLAQPNSVYMVFLLGIDDNGTITTALCSLFDRRLLEGTSVLHHWAGRNSRGVTQFMGNSLLALLGKPEEEIDLTMARASVEHWLAL